MKKKFGVNIILGILVISIILGIGGIIYTACNSIYAANTREDFTFAIDNETGKVKVYDDLLIQESYGFNMVLPQGVKMQDVTLYEKNNSFKLSDGRTIQDAIIDNTYLRRLKSSYDNMLKYKDSKKRITEVNNSYFDCYEVNYDSDEIRKKSKELEKQIQRTDFEISKLNSIEFEISL